MEAPDETPSGTSTSQPTPDETAPSSEGDDGLVLQSQRPGSELGGPCHQDQECTQPLRCLDLVCARPPGVDGEVSDVTPRIVLAVDTDHPVRVYVEVADTPFEVQRGLMFRTRMAPDWGMLFVFGDEQPRSFWMRNTYLALDMLFIRSDGEIVRIAQHARPLDEGPRYESVEPARYVLEVNAGFAHEHGLVAGQRVRLVDVPGSHDPQILQ